MSAKVIRARWRFRIKPTWWEWAKWGLLFGGAVAALAGGLYSVVLAWEQRPDPGPGGGQRLGDMDETDETDETGSKAASG